MKKGILSIALVAMSFIGSVSFAQKFGYVDAQKLMMEMPEVVQAQKELERFSKEKEMELQDMSTRFEQSVAQYQQDAPNLTPEIAQSREKELLEKQQIIQQFQQNAEMKIQQKEQELIATPREKLLKAIDKVAADNNYNYIFDASMLLYKQGDDVSELIKAELAKTSTTTTK